MTVTHLSTAWIKSLLHRDPQLAPDSGSKVHTPRVIFCAYDRAGHVAGGPNTWLRRLLPDLRAEGFDVHALVMYAGDLALCPLISSLRENGFPVSTLSLSEVSFVDDQIRWLSAQVSRIKPTVFVANLVTPAFYASRWIKAAGISTVGVFHTSEAFSEGMRRRFVAGATGDAFTAAVCVSEMLASRLGRENPNEVRLARIPCGAPVPASTQRSFDSNLRVLYLGRIAQSQKNALDVGRAFCLAAKSLPDISFSIVGTGPDESELEALIAASEFGNRVRFLGPVAVEEVSTVLDDHDVIVLLSEVEGLPIALLEGMAHGLVPVCLDEPSGIDEVIIDGVNGLKVKDRSQSFISALHRLQLEPALMQRLSAAARVTVENEYSTEINHRRWAELLFQISADARPSRVQLPARLRLPRAEPSFGGEDARKSPVLDRISTRLKVAYFELRQAVRPRARLRDIVQNRN